MKFNIVVLPGDGIGPEIIDAAVTVLQAVGKRYGHTFDLYHGLIGGAAIDATGVPLPPNVLKMSRKSDAVLMGAVGDPKFDVPGTKVRPEDGMLALRKKLELFANLRPVKALPMLINASNLKRDIIEGVDFIFIRELTGGLYFGKPKKRWQTPEGWRAVDTMTYSQPEIERILRVGFELARTRKKKLVSVDKANVLECSRLWRQIAIELSKSYPDVELEHMLVDATSMRLIQNPKHFDVVVSENTFGDILTDEASMLAGSMGMLPSASLAGIPQKGMRTLGLYEPAHGSAPRRAGQNLANPIATILSMAMMLRYSCGLEKEAASVEAAVIDVLNEGYRTYDIMDESKTKVGTKELGKLVAGKA